MQSRLAQCLLEYQYTQKRETDHFHVGWDEQIFKYALSDSRFSRIQYTESFAMINSAKYCIC